jgi:hypothetical protein
MRDELSLSLYNAISEIGNFTPKSHKTTQINQSIACMQKRDATTNRDTTSLSSRDQDDLTGV